MRGGLAAALALAGLLVGGAARAEGELRIGYLGIVDDPRFVQDWGYARLITPPPIRTEEAARMAVADMAFLTEAVQTTVTLDARLVTPDQIAATAKHMAEAGNAFIVMDLPEPSVRSAAAALAGAPVVMINATAPEDALRSACIPGMLHAGPSLRMQSDAFAQYLRAMNWTRVLVLEGEDPADAGLADAFVAAAERMRLVIADRRGFTLAADPASREGNNVRLLTSGADYDLVFVADTRGEFGRYVPYGTQLPRPVIGSVGLTSVSWHWAMERDGATQVSSRFDKQTGRRMSGPDWNVWIAVKSVIQAALKSGKTAPDEIAAYMASDRFRLDGSKGVTLNYRPWDGQLRMPLLLASTDAVIVVAPVEGFTHQKNDLDTLGTDEAEFVCE